MAIRKHKTNDSTYAHMATADATVTVGLQNWKNSRAQAQLKKYMKSENEKMVMKIIQKGDLDHLFSTEKSSFLTWKITKKVVFEKWWQMLYKKVI